MRCRCRDRGSATVELVLLTPLLIVMLLFVVLMVIDSLILGRLVNKRVRERFPDSTDGGFKLGLYAFTRAMQLRMMRAPRPRVSLGAKV